MGEWCRAKTNRVEDEVHLGARCHVAASPLIAQDGHRLEQCVGPQLLKHLIDGPDTTTANTERASKQ